MVDRLRIGISVNEVSGDQLAAGLIKALHKIRPDLSFEGMTGPLTEQQGCRSIVKMDPVMGLFEIIKHLPGLLRARKKLYREMTRTPPALFIGIDAPDFNLPLERRLKSAGIKTVHMVCPSVWAWRQGRAKRFKECVDLMLCLFSFEPEFLSRYGVRAIHIGHPLADRIPLEDQDPKTQRLALELDPDRPTLAILPGSRMSEVTRLSDPFIQTAAEISRLRPETQFVLPCVNRQIHEYVSSRLAEIAPDVSIKLIDGQSDIAMQAADVILTASGTATLEGLLYKRPMVVGYKLSAMTYWLIKTFNLMKISRFALANLVSERPMAEELMQDDCTADKLTPAVMKLFDSADLRDDIKQHYTQVHQNLRCDAMDTAAKALIDLLQAPVGR